MASQGSDSPADMRRDAVRAKLAALGLVEADVADAVRWARQAGAGRAASKAAEPGAGFEAGGPRGGKLPARRKQSRRA